MNDVIRQLTAWLDHPVYQAGVVLYEKYIGSGFLLTMLQGGRDDYNESKLLEALLAKRDELADAQQARIEQYPQALTDRIEAGKLLMDERTILKERLRMQLNSGFYASPDAKDWAFRILDIRDELGQIYGRKDFFDSHGYLPEVASIDADLGPAQLVKRQLTLRTYLVRYRVDTIPETHPRYQKNLALLQKYTSELHAIEQQLAALSPTVSGNVPLHD